MPELVRPPVSLRLRLTLLATAVTLIAVVAAGMFLIRSVRDTQLAKLHDAAAASVETARQRLEAGDDYTAALTGLAAPVFASDEAGGCVTTFPGVGNGAVACSIGESTEDTATIPPAPDSNGTSRPSGGAPPPSVSAPQRTEGYGTETVSVTANSPRYGVVTLTSPTPEDQVTRAVSSVRHALVIVLPLLAVAVAGTSWVLAGKALRPVERIRRQADSISGSSLELRLPEPTVDDEIGRLARTMNSMLDRLDRSARRQQEFISDASHELRSPVAAIRNEVEVALADPDADWSAVGHTVLAEESRLERLLADLLVLAAADEGQPASMSTQVDIEALLAEECTRQRRVRVRLHLDESSGPCIAAGSTTRLQQVFTNVLDNASQHATGMVEVNITSADGHVTVHIDDDGPGIPVAERQRVFERFTRLGHDRARRAGGTGLGLAVVQTIVHRAHGTVTVHDSPLGGARLTVVLPHATS